MKRKIRFQYYYLVLLISFRELKTFPFNLKPSYQSPDTPSKIDFTCGYREIFFFDVSPLILYNSFPRLKGTKIRNFSHSFSAWFLLIFLSLVSAKQRWMDGSSSEGRWEAEKIQFMKPNQSRNSRECIR